MVHQLEYNLVVWKVQMKVKKKVEKKVEN